MNKNTTLDFDTGRKKLLLINPLELDAGMGRISYDAELQAVLAVQFLYESGMPRPNFVFCQSARYFHNLPLATKNFMWKLLESLDEKYSNARNPKIRKESYFCAEQFMDFQAPCLSPKVTSKWAPKTEFAVVFGSASNMREFACRATGNEFFHKNPRDYKCNQSFSGFLITADQWNYEKNAKDVSVKSFVATDSGNQVKSLSNKDAGLRQEINRALSGDGASFESLVNSIPRAEWLVKEHRR